MRPFYFPKKGPPRAPVFARGHADPDGLPGGDEQRQSLTGSRDEASLLRVGRTGEAGSGIFFFSPRQAISRWLPGGALRPTPRGCRRLCGVVLGDASCSRRPKTDGEAVTQPLLEGLVAAAGALVRERQCIQGNTFSPAPAVKPDTGVKARLSTELGTAGALRVREAAAPDTRSVLSMLQPGGLLQSLTESLLQRTAVRQPPLGAHRASLFFQSFPLLQVAAYQGGGLTHPCSCSLHA